MAISRECQGLIDYMSGSGVPFVVTSVNTGAHARGSYHYQQGTGAVGLAVDFAHKLGGPRDSQELANIFNVFLPLGSPAPSRGQIAELFYAGPQVTVNIKHNKRVGLIDAAQHHDHVHVAVERGVFFGPYQPKSKGDEDMPLAPDARVGFLAAPNAGPRAGWELTADGGVRAINGTPFYGSYPGLPTEERQGTRTFTAITPNEDGSIGYTLWSNDGAHYEFGPGRNGY